VSSVVSAVFGSDKVDSEVILSEVSEDSLGGKLNLFSGLSRLDRERLVSGVLNLPEVDSVGSISVGEVDVLALNSSSSSKGNLAFLAGDLLDLPPLLSLLIVSMPQINVSLSTVVGDGEEVSVATVLSLRLDGVEVLSSLNRSNSPVVGHGVSALVLEPSDVVAVVDSARQHHLLVKLALSLDESLLRKLDGLHLIRSEGSNSDVLLVGVSGVPEIESIP
jgi:hypothetical protein